MNAITEQQPVSAQTLEHVLGTGDLSKLTTQQRVEYYARTCQSLGLNPLTRPFRFLSLNGGIQLYATRDCTDQLRKVNGIALHIVDKQIDAGLFLVTVRAKDKHGREDEDMGAVALPASGESRANALMKAMTKAKRRVTLSICGLGLTDEAELDTMPGAMVFDAEEEPPVVPLKAAAADMPRAPRVTEKQAAAQEGGKPHAPERTDDQWRAWLVKLRDACAVLRSRSEVEEVASKDTVGDALRDGPPWVRREIDDILADSFARFADAPADDLPEVQIAGEELAASG